MTSHRARRNQRAAALRIERRERATVEQSRLTPAPSATRHLLSWDNGKGTQQRHVFPDHGDACRCPDCA